jgi:hypothetical protein
VGAPPARHEAAAAAERVRMGEELEGVGESATLGRGGEASPAGIAGVEAR